MPKHPMAMSERVRVRMIDKYHSDFDLCSAFCNYTPDIKLVLEVFEDGQWKYAPLLANVPDRVEE